MAIAPKYECVIAFTVSAFNSPHYTNTAIPRVNTILNLVSLQLLHDKKNQ